MGKFDENAYAYSAGLNGVGNKAINALSTETIVTVKRDGYIHQAKFSKGKIVSPLKKGKATKETGTSTKFYPDIEILKDVTIEIERYRTFMRHISYLNKGIEFNFKATTKDGKSTIEKYYSKNGIKDFAKDLQKNPLKGTKVIYLEGTENDIPVEVAIAYTKGEEEINRAFCNGIENIEGGTHATGFRMGLSSVVTKYINDNKLIPKKEGKLEITGEDCREGVIAIISIKHKNALFSSQQKIRLTNTDAQGAVMKIVNSQLAEYFKIHKDEAKIICEKAILAAKGRNAAKRARLNTKKAAESFSSISNLSKFTQCSSKDPELRELYIMEGDSAAGSFIQARNPEFHACYRLRGKPRNTHDLNVIKIMANKEFNDLCQIIGIEPNKEIDFEKVKFHKIIFLSDADTDGSHICALLLTFFFKHAYELVKRGYIYVGQPPLYLVKEGNKEIYLKNVGEYRQYIDTRVANTFNLIINDEIIPTNNFKKLLKLVLFYREDLTDLAGEYFISPELFEFIMCYSRSKNFKSILPKKYPELTVKEQKNGSYIVEGIYDNIYQKIIIDSVFKEKTKHLFKLLKDNGLIKLKFSLKSDPDNVKTSSLNHILNYMYKYCEPKFRQRFKGLGRNLPLIIAIL